MNWKILLSLTALICSLIPQSFSLLAKAESFSPHHLSITQNEAMNLPEKLTTANTKFAFNLFTEIFSQAKNENVFVSPRSISIALSMLYNGANSTTQEAMVNSLQLEGMSLTEINRTNQLLRENLINADPKVQLEIANSLWMRQDFSFKPEFIDINKKYYQAETKTLDFANTESLNIINNWVKENTKGKIDTIIEEIYPEDVMFLINAMYFKGDWTDQFDKNKTKEKPFYLDENQTKIVNMMSRFGRYKYLENEQFTAVNLPYGEEERLGMYIFLPKKSSDLETFSKVLNAENWTNWMTEFNYQEGTVEMPRFQLEYELELREILNKLGMGIIFDPQKADFSKISQNPIFVSGVKHKTFLEVNEEGTEAAAVTSIGIRTTSVNLDQPFKMIIDRPFFCVIKDEKTGSILFMGAVFNP